MNGESFVISGIKHKWGELISNFGSERRDLLERELNTEGKFN